MEKSIIVTIYVDDVNLADIGEVQEAIESIFVDYEHKRITTQIQDDRLVSPRL